MDCTCVDSAIDQLSRLLKRPSLTLLMKQEIRTLLLDLRFLQMFFRCLAKCKAAEEDTTLHHLRSSLLMNAEAMTEETGQDLYDAGYFASIGIDVKDWNLVAAKFQEKVEHLKPEISKTCILLVDCSLEPKTSNSDGMVEFMDSILMNLKDLVSSHEGIVVPVKVQTEALQEKLRFSRNFLNLTENRCGRQEQDKLEAFSTVLRDWAKNAACLSLLYWMDSVDENMAAHINTMLHNMLQKIMPYSPKVIDMYLELLKACKSSKADKSVMGEIVTSFLDVLLENVVVAVKDHIEGLQDGLVLLITFIMDPPEEFGRKSRTVIFTQIYAVIREMAFFICSLCSDKMNDDTFRERNTLLPDLLKKIKEVEAEVRELNGKKPSSWHFDFPVTDAIGFIDFLLGNLNKSLKYNANFVPFAKHKIVTIRHELLFFRPFLEDIMELQNESVELKDLWTRIINVAYLAEHVINSCATADTPIWSNIICLSDVTDEIKHIQAEVMKIKQNQLSSKRNPSIQKNYSFSRPQQVFQVLMKL